MYWVIVNVAKCTGINFKLLQYTAIKNLDIKYSKL